MADLPWTWLAIRASGITAWALLTAVVVWARQAREGCAGREGRDREGRREKGGEGGGEARGQG